MALTLSRLANIFATPTDVFVNLKEKPLWFPAFIVIAVISVGVALFTAPFTRHITSLALSQSQNLSREQIEQALALSDRFKYIGLAFVPIIILLRWSVLGALLYFSAILLGATELRFKQVYAALVFSEMILLLMGVINILLLYIKGIESIQNITDLQAIVGLDYFLSDKAAHLPLFTFLNSINVFSIWYVATLSIGLCVITNFSKLKSAVLVSAVWLLGVGFQVALAAISSKSSPLPAG